MTDDLPTPQEILNTHEEIEEVYNLKFTGSRVAAPKLHLRKILSETSEYDNVHYRAAHLLRNLITGHLFEDGNKRTAWVTTREYLARYGHEPAGRSENVERVLRRVRRYDVDELAEWLDTGDIDSSRL